MSFMLIEDDLNNKFNSGQFSELPTDLPTITVYGSSRQPFLHGKIPMGSPWVAQSAAHYFHIRKKWVANLLCKIPMGSLHVLHCPLSCPLFHIWK